MFYRLLGLYLNQIFAFSIFQYILNCIPFHKLRCYGFTSWITTPFWKRCGKGCRAEGSWLPDNEMADCLNTGRVCFHTKLTERDWNLITLTYTQVHTQECRYGSMQRRVLWSAPTRRPHCGPPHLETNAHTQKRKSQRQVVSTSHRSVNRSKIQNISHKETLIPCMTGTTGEWEVINRRRQTFGKAKKKQRTGKGGVWGACAVDHDAGLEGRGQAPALHANQISQLRGLFVHWHWWLLGAWTLLSSLPPAEGGLNKSTHTNIHRKQRARTVLINTSQAFFTRLWVSSLCGRFSLFVLVSTWLQSLCLLFPDSIHLFFCGFCLSVGQQQNANQRTGLALWRSERLFFEEVILCIWYEGDDCCQ